jgi:putative transposase
MKGDRILVKNSEEIEKRLPVETDARVKPRLIFLNAIANCGISYDLASKICGLNLSTGYVWIRKWNAEGYEGLKDKDTRTGRPPKLDEDDMVKLKEILNGRDYWTTKEVVKEIKVQFGVDLSYHQTIKVLRDKFGMRFSKPYPMDYRKPANAEMILDNELDLTFSLLKAKGIKEEEIAIGFIDEARPQNTANTVKVWSFEKVRSVKNTTKFKANTIGFYAIKGNNVTKFLENSKAPSIANFLVDIRNSNKAYPAIVVIVDGFPSHKSDLVKQKAKELGIYLVYLPPYSPELNPEQFIWKSIKRVLSLSFPSTLEEMKQIITSSWSEFSGSMSYAKHWIERFLFNNYCYTELR